MNTSVSVFSCELDFLPLSEVYRYMGMGAYFANEGKKDSSVDKLVADLTEGFVGGLAPKACYVKVDVDFKGGSDADINEASNAVVLGDLCVNSASLKKHLAGCSHAYLFVATIGHEADRKKAKAALASQAEALVMDAMGSAAIEEFCDILCDNFSDIESKKLRPRFSPGYKDVPLDFQKDLLPYLDSGRLIGVTLNDSLLMQPVKSVSAIVGVPD